jgi:outer membrane protein OmpA-like peptidoglycan-associated protein
MDSMIVDEKGEYNFLVRPNKQYELIASKPGFISTGFKLDSKNLYEGDLLNDVVLEEVYIEKEVVLFDYNKSTVSEQSMAQMKRVVRTLKRDPSATLNIGAHADSRGSNETNKRISERRAAAAVDYFVKQGISRKRIEAVGFGEELILNRCSDGVICPEEEHSMNRRAEIKVQGITIRQ